jgi:hypothetical protein
MGQVLEFPTAKVRPAAAIRLNDPVVIALRAELSLLNSGDVAFSLIYPGRAGRVHRTVAALMLRRAADRLDKGPTP